jgi:NAD(P)-dependent dehydrogenase (short-subunit alcohol dehydrogenase family)
MSEALGYDGKVAIITGSGGGLGREHALLLASRGALVVINDLGGAIDGTGSDKGAAERMVDEIKALGGEAVADTNSVATVEGGRRRSCRRRSTPSAGSTSSSTTPASSATRRSTT